MAVISFLEKQEHNWVVARWAYRQILEDVISHCPADSEMIGVLADKMESDGLLMEFLEPALAARITSAIKRVAEGILSGAIRSAIQDKPSGTAHMVQEYRKGLQELLETIPSRVDHP